MQKFSNKNSSSDQAPSLLFLSKLDVVACGVDNMAAAIESIKEAFLLFSQGKIKEAPKLRFNTSTQADGDSGITSSASWIATDEKSLYGCTVLTSKAKNLLAGIPRTQGVLILFDAKTSSPVCIMEASLMNTVRTGAISALAARFLCPKIPLNIGLIGAGAQMRTQLIGLRHALGQGQIKRVKVFSRGDSKNKFTREMSREIGLVVTPADSLGQALDASSVIIIAAADNCDPLINEELAAELATKKGMTLISLGHHDVPMSLLGTMDRVVASSWEHTKVRAGHVITKAVKEGIIQEDEVEELGAIVSGAIPGRTSSEENIFFCPTGMAFADLQLGSNAYRVALRNGIGTFLQL